MIQNEAQRFSEMFCFLFAEIDVERRTREVRRMFIYWIEEGTND